MRTASLLIALLLLSPAQADFCLDVSGYLSKPKESSPWSAENSAFDYALALSEWASDVAATYGDTGLVEDQSNLVAQFDKLFQSSARELRNAADRRDSQSFEDVVYQVMFLTLILGLWIYRRRRSPQTSLAKAQAMLGQLRVEMKSFEHSHHSLEQIESELAEFCKSANLKTDAMDHGKFGQTMATQRLVSQIAVQLAKHPMRPSSYAAAVQQFSGMLELLQSERVLELEYRRRLA